MFFAVRGEVAGTELKPINAVVGNLAQAGIEGIRSDGMDCDLGTGIDNDLPALIAKEGQRVGDDGGPSEVPFSWGSDGVEGKEMFGWSAVEGAGGLDSTAVMKELSQAAFLAFVTRDLEEGVFVEDREEVGLLFIGMSGRGGGPAVIEELQLCDDRDGLTRKVEPGMGKGVFPDESQAGGGLDLGKGFGCEGLRSGELLGEGMEMLRELGGLFFGDDGPVLPMEKGVI